MRRASVKLKYLKTVAPLLAKRAIIHVKWALYRLMDSIRWDARRVVREQRPVKRKQSASHANLVHFPMYLAVVCRQCKPGFVSPNASLPCVECPAGRYAQETHCDLCPRGFYCNATSAEPIMCPPGLFASFGGSAADCDECPKGRYCTSSGAQPSPCGATYYSNQTRATSNKNVLALR